MYRITAWREPGGLYRLYGKTYHKRGELKAGGARWNPEGKYWLASRELAGRVGADIMTQVRVAARCHMPEKVVAVSHREAEQGFARMGCPMCDTSIRCGWNVEILEVLGECIIGGANANSN